MEVLQAEGACGAGQSSWGPAVYGLVQGDAAAQRIADRLRGRLAGRAPVLVTGFDTRGARCWTA